MTGEAIGDAVTGGLWADAVSPPASQAREAKHPALCLNCGTRLVGTHCHACGQGAHVHRTVGAIGHEIAHGVFHFEGRIWRTLPLLVLRPGELTRRYVAGERQRFVSPLALFLFTVFLMFAIVASLPGWDLGKGVGVGSEVRLAEARDKIAEQRRNADAELARLTRRLKQERSAFIPDRDDVAATEARIAEVRDAQATLGRAARLLPGGPETAAKHDESGLSAKWREAKRNPEFLFYKFKSSAYKFSWALIPLSLPFVWILFPFRRDVGLYDHAVFTTYSLAFMSLLAIVLAVAGAIGWGAWAGLAWVLIPPAHMFAQLRGAYRLRKRGALWRTVLLVMFATIILFCFALALLFNGISH